MAAPKTPDPASKYEVREQVGKGAFGAAILVLNRETRQQYIMKKVRLARQSSWQRQSTLQEKEMVSNLCHPFIVPHIESWIHHGHTVHIVYGYCEKGDLTSFLKKQDGKPIAETQLRVWLAEMLLAVGYMHANNVLHRDIKCSNIFVTSDDDLQIGDFGLATYRGTDNEGNEDQNLVGTPHYMSPELLSQKGYSFESDIWSLGCVMYELTTGRPPFNAFNLQGLVGKIRKSMPAPMPDTYSEQWHNIVKSMLLKDPGRRPTVQRLLAQPILQEALRDVYQRAAKIMPDVQLPPLPDPSTDALITTEDQDVDVGGAIDTTDNNIVQRLEDSLRMPLAGKPRIDTASRFNAQYMQPEVDGNADDKASSSSLDSPSNSGVQGDAAGLPSSTTPKAVAWGPTVNGREDTGAGPQGDTQAASSKSERQASSSEASSSGPKLTRNHSARRAPASQQQPEAGAPRRTTRRASSANILASKPKPAPVNTAALDAAGEGPLRRSLSLTGASPQPLPSPREPSPRKGRAVLSKTPSRRQSDNGVVTAAPPPRRAMSTPRQAWGGHRQGASGDPGEPDKRPVATSGGTASAGGSSATAPSDTSQRPSTVSAHRRRTSDTGGVFDRLFKTPTVSRRAAAAAPPPATTADAKEQEPKDKEKDRDRPTTRRETREREPFVGVRERDPKKEPGTAAGAQKLLGRAPSAGRTSRDRGRAHLPLSVLASAPAHPSPVPEERSSSASPARSVTDSGAAGGVHSHDLSRMELDSLSETSHTALSTGATVDLPATPEEREPVTPQGEPLPGVFTPGPDRRFSTDSFDSPLDTGSYPPAPGPRASSVEEPADVRPLLREMSRTEGDQQRRPGDDSSTSIEHVFVNMMFDAVEASSPADASMSRLPSRHDSMFTRFQNEVALGADANTAGTPASVQTPVNGPDASQGSSVTEPRPDSVLSMSGLVVSPRAPAADEAVTSADPASATPSPLSFDGARSPLFRTTTAVLRDSQSMEEAAGAFASPLSHWATQTATSSSAGSTPRSAVQFRSSNSWTPGASPSPLATPPAPLGSGSAAHEEQRWQTSWSTSSSQNLDHVRAEHGATREDTVNGFLHPPAMQAASEERQRLEVLESVVRLCQGLVRMQRGHELAAVLSSPALQQLGLPLGDSDPALVATVDSFSLGDVVLIGSKQPLRGTIRYCGPVHWDEGVWVGLELDRPVGKNDGTVAGIRYFTAANNTGLFARASSLRPQHHGNGNATAH